MGGVQRCVGVVWVAAAAVWLAYDPVSSPVSLWQCGRIAFSRCGMRLGTARVTAQGEGEGGELWVVCGEAWACSGCFEHLHGAGMVW